MLRSSVERFGEGRERGKSMGEEDDKHLEDADREDRDGEDGKGFDEGVIVIGLAAEGCADEEEEEDEEGGLEEALGSDEVGFAEGRERTKVEELGEGPEEGEGDEEDASGPEGIEVPQIRGGVAEGLDAEMEDEGDRGDREEERMMRKMMVVRSIKELGVIIATHSEGFSSQGRFSRGQGKSIGKEAAVVVNGEGCTGSVQRRERYARCTRGWKQGRKKQKLLLKARVCYFRAAD